VANFQVWQTPIINRSVSVWCGWGQLGFGIRVCGDWSVLRCNTSFDASERTKGRGRKL